MHSLSPRARPSGAVSQRRFAIEALEQRIAPSSSLLDVGLSFNVVLMGPMKNVRLSVDNVYLIVQNNVIQASTGGTLVGSVG
jgi:hypothetical protein